MVIWGDKALELTESAALKHRVDDFLAHEHSDEAVDEMGMADVGLLKKLAAL